METTVKETSRMAGHKFEIISSFKFELINWIWFWIWFFWIWIWLNWIWNCWNWFWIWFWIWFWFWFWFWLNWKLMLELMLELMLLSDTIWLQLEKANESNLESPPDEEISSVSSHKKVRVERAKRENRKIIPGLALVTTKWEDCWKLKKVDK